jgi:serine/threonine-protein kinase CHEK2
MESPNKYLDEKMCKMLIYQVMIALKYLHANNCGHLDVKCENILISFLASIPPADSKQQSNNRYKHELPLAKLADFGYSNIIGEYSFRKTRVGTVCFLFVNLTYFSSFSLPLTFRNCIVHQKSIVVKKVIID